MILKSAFKRESRRAYEKTAIHEKNSQLEEKIIMKTENNYTIRMKSSRWKKFDKFIKFTILIISIIALMMASFTSN